MANSDKILVLLSTYNGQHFITEQLESLAQQVNVAIDVLIRDDGSTDQTVSIVEQFCKTHTNFRLIKGSNIGVINSFNTLISDAQTIHYQWFAFCDQDDVWYPQKLFRALSILKQHKNQIKPLLYCSNLDIVDSKLNHITNKYSQTPHFSYYTATVQNIATGCTCVFNKHALDLYKKGINQRMEMHDYWLFLVCLFFGSVVYDIIPYIKYRQHAFNVIGYKKHSLLTVLNNYVHTTNSKRLEMLADFLCTYQIFLNTKQYNIINLVLKSSRSWLSRFQIVFNPQYHGYAVKTTLAFKWRVLVGKLY